jgi:hypothetical protein
MKLDRSRSVLRAPRSLVVAFGLLAATLALYSRALDLGFVFDDRQYLLLSPHVGDGLTGAGFLWALRSFSASNWHPLTWISHMLDVQLFGMTARWHHFTSLILDRKSTRLNSSHNSESRMPSSA